MSKLFIICGHGAGDPGACGHGYEEAERVRALGKRIKELGGDAVTLADTSRNFYSDGGILTDYVPSDASIVELHMDSADVSARGGHILVKSGIGLNDYDRGLANFISTYFPGRAESIQYVTWLKNANSAYYVHKDYRLIECGFISNIDDLTKFNNGIDDIAKGILAVYGITPNETPSVPETPTVTPTPSSDSDFHGGAYRCTVNGLNVRTSPSLSAASVAHYDKGAVVILDDWYTIADGYVWGCYTGSTSGKIRYIAIGKATGKPESDDYLVKC